MARGVRNGPASKIRGGSSAALAGFLAVAAVGGGLYYATTRPVQRVAPPDDTLAQVAALARVEKDTEWLQRAIREREAIVGMTYREVETAKGRPHRKQRGEELPESHRAKGGVENWIYEVDGGPESSVLFGANGLVIFASDVEGKPRQGHVIRQR
jgi:hypothetical protein